MNYKAHTRLASQRDGFALEFWTIFSALGHERSNGWTSHMDDAELWALYPGY